MVFAESAGTMRLVLFLYLLIFLRRIGFARQVIVEDLMSFLFFLNLFLCVVFLLLRIDGIGLSFSNLLDLR